MVNQQNTTSDFILNIQKTFMYKTLLFIPSVFIASILYAQEPADALRFSWTVPGGTARQQAIGGAMGSLGGDLTATFVNPAGLGFYKTGDIVFSPAYHFGRNKSSYLGRTEKEEDKKFDIGTTGFIWASGNKSGKIKSSALSIAFNTTANFKNDLLYRGLNNESSFSQKFVEEIRNNRPIDITTAGEKFPFGSSLAFNTYWVDTFATGGAGYDFYSLASRLLSTGLLQEQKISNRGGIYEGALGLAVNMNDKLMFGGSLSLPYLHYNRKAAFNEVDATENGNNNFNFASFTEELTTKGLGINAKLGLIYKPQEYWRLGLAVHTPTIYSLTDNYEAEITTDTEGYKGLLTDYSKDYTNNGESEFSYTLITPYKAIGSISYVLREIQDVTKQKGFLTADIEYINYKASSFQENEDENEGSDPETKSYLKTLNNAIDNAYKGAFNFRVGGELKFTTIMVRAGAAYYGNPYKNINDEKGRKINLSGGFGYRNKGMFIDFTYIHSMQKDVHTPYRLETARYAHANVKSTVGNVVMTIGYKL